MLSWLSLLRSEIKSQATDTRGDDYLIDALRHVEGRLRGMFYYTFMPVVDTLYCDARGEQIDPLRQNLELPMPLLEATTITIGDATTLTWGTQVIGIPSTYPYWWLHLKPAKWGSWQWPSSDGDWVNAISISGVWGYRTGYTQAWLSSGDTVEDNPLSSSATTITVNAVDGVDAFNRTPRLSRGQLLKIDSEYVEVLDTPTNTTLTVRRAVNGSTAASHVQNTAISIWTAEPAIERAVNRWVNYLYTRRSEFSKASYDGVATTSFPPDVPEEVNHILDELTPKRVWVL